MRSQAPAAGQPALGAGAAANQDRMHTSDPAHWRLARQAPATPRRPQTGASCRCICDRGVVAASDVGPQPFGLHCIRRAARGARFASDLRAIVPLLPGPVSHHTERSAEYSQRSSTALLDRTSCATSRGKPRPGPGGLHSHAQRTRAGSAEAQILPIVGAIRLPSGPRSAAASRRCLESMWRMCFNGSRTATTIPADETLHSALWQVIAGR